MIKNVKLLKVVRKKTKLKNTSVKTKKAPSKDTANYKRINI